MAQAMATSSEQMLVTETVQRNAPTSPSVVLKLHKPKNDKKVKWDEQTVDNENMNKKKSKCCCIYNKPRIFGESSSEDSDDDCTGSCHGHKKKCYQKVPHDGTDGDHSHEKQS